MNNTANIVLYSDNNYIKLLVPCITSIIHNSKSTTKLNIYILEGKISKYNKDKIQQISHDNKLCTITFIDVDEASNDYIASTKYQKQYSKAIIYKLFIPKLFATLDRILWLDADMIVNTDLLELYNQDLTHYYLSAPLVSINSKYLKQIIIHDGKPISIAKLLSKVHLEFNQDIQELTLKPLGGVLLFNNTKILQDNKQDQLINLALKYQEFFHFIDEDTLGIVFHNKIKHISELYNFMPTQRKHYYFFSAQDKTAYDNLASKAYIIHYLGHKPHKLLTLWRIADPLVFYKYYQMSYLKMNCLMLKINFMLADLVFGIYRVAKFLQFKKK